MRRGERWLLPDGVDEVIPPDVEPLEQLRRDILDLFKSWGYELVVPPLVEFIESLQSGNGEDLDLQTFKITDQVSGRMMGVRADMTPQVARIDAHRLPTDLPQRLSYVGPVLHTRPDKFAGSRNPLQVGAELYGHEGIESDAEVVCLMADVLRRAGLLSVTIELGHMGLFKSLIELAGLNVDAADKLLDALLRKDVADVTECLDEYKVETGARNLLLALLKLNGGIGVIARAKKALAGAPASVLEALEALENLTDLLVERIPEVDLHVDLAELRGYRYHTGVTFAAYMPGEGRQIAWGGRYDNIGREFGRHRAATGFSTDLKNLSRVRRPQNAARMKVFAPADQDPALRDTIERLRNDGTVVVQELPGQVGDARAMRCTHILKRVATSWQTEPLSD
jgi:ATP phosphoribosyltransferase regulatory subunit